MSSTTAAPRTVRAAAIFARVVVGVVRDPHHKGTMFTVEERVAFLEDAVSGYDNVEVEVPLFDVNRRTIGGVEMTFPYVAGLDEDALVRTANSISGRANAAPMRSASDASTNYSRAPTRTSSRRSSS